MAIPGEAVALISFEVTMNGGEVAFSGCVATLTG